MATETQPQAPAAAPAVYAEYRVHQFWAGWWGGWGDEGKIAERLNEMARQGWHMVSTKTSLCFWMWVVPRHKLLIFFERRA